MDDDGPVTMRVTTMPTELVEEYRRTRDQLRRAEKQLEEAALASFGLAIGDCVVDTRAGLSYRICAIDIMVDCDMEIHALIYGKREDQPDWPPVRLWPQWLMKEEKGD